VHIKKQYKSCSAVDMVPFETNTKKTRLNSDKFKKGIVTESNDANQCFGSELGLDSIR
jgi:hypothetical protein